MSFPYRSVLITGASSGIGEAIARKLARPGIRLILVARSSEKLHSLAADLEKTGASAVVVVKDLIRPESCTELFEAVRHLNTDLLVNNAGFGSYGYFHESALDKENDMISLNVRALLNLTRLFLPDMVKNNHGAIINISSMAGFQPVPFMATYAATKAFVTSFSLAIAAELKTSGIRVIDVCPGRTKTNFQVISGSNRIRIRSRAASAESVADVTINALLKNRKIAIEGLRNKLTLHIQRFFSREMALKTAYKIFKPKTQ